MQKLTHEIYSFDEFKLDLTRGALFRGARELKLRPKSFDVLKYFAENSGRLISKDEIIEAVWHETAVTDDSLVQCLKDIRNALGDQSQTIIRTVPRRGYIFDKEVRDNGSSVYMEETSGVRLVIEESEEINGHVEGISRQRQLSVGSKTFIGSIKRHKIAAVVASVGLVLVVTAGILLYRPVLLWWFKPPSIAILPIVNASGDASLDYVSDGLTESLITSLFQLNTPDQRPRLRVFAQNTMSMFKNKSVEPRSVGHELGADTILASRMFEQKNLRTFKFELINVADGSIVWSKQYSVEPDKPFQILERQDEMARDIAAHLPLSLSESDLATLTHRYTQNGEAYDLYLRGRAEFWKLMPSSLERSVEYYQQAIGLDPNFALAYWAMGVSYTLQAVIDERSMIDANEKSVDLFQKALKIDNNLAVGQNSMKIKEGDTWNWEAIKTAGPTHPAYGHYLIVTGRANEEVENLKARLSMAPYNPVLNFRYCGALAAAGRIDDAIEQCKKTLNLVPAPDRVYLGPESPWTHLELALMLTRKKMFQEAIAEQKTALALGENSKTLQAELASIYVQAGRQEEGVKILNQLLERGTSGEFLPSLNIAFVYCNLGDKERAFAWLDKAFDEREDRLPGLRRPDCDSIRDDPRYADLVKRMGLPN